MPQPRSRYDRVLRRMEFKYQNSSVDLQAVMRFVPFWQRVWPRFGWLLQLLACTLPGAIILFALGEFLIPLVAWALLGLLAATRFMALQRQRPTESTQAESTQAVMTLRFEADYLECTTPQGCGRRDWSLVRRVRLTQEFLLLFLVQQRVFAIPRRAFSSRQEMERAAETAQRYFEAAHDRPHTDDRPPAFSIPAPPATPIGPEELIAPEEPIGPDGNGIEVRFRNTAQEIVQVRHLGMQRPASRLTVGLALALSTIMLTVFLVSFRDTQGVERAFASTLFMLLSGFACLCAWILLNPIVEARCVPPEVLLPVTLTLSTDGVWLRSPKVVSFESWSGFSAVPENDQFVGLMRRGPRELVLIPKSSFENEGDLQRFESLASEAIDRASRLDQQSLTAPGGPTAAGETVADTGNPYQPPGS